MSRRLLAAVILLSGALAAPAQQPEGWAHKLFVSPDNKPVTGKDFGLVPKGPQLHESFKLSNIYGVPLSISTGVSCDCITVTVSKQVLQPREQGTLEISMDTRRFSGPKAVNVFFTVANQQYTSTAVLKVQANCRIDVTVNPGTVNFGVVPRGQTTKQKVEVDYAGALPWQITPEVHDELFDIEVKPRLRQPGRVGYDVFLTVKADANPGSYKRDVLLPTNDPASPHVPVPVEIVVQSSLQVFPSPVRFNSMAVGTEATMPIIVRGAGQKIKLSSVDGLGDGLTLTEALPTEAKTVHNLRVKWVPDKAGTLNRRLTFHIEGDKNATASVVVEGTATQ